MTVALVSLGIAVLLAGRALRKAINEERRRAFRDAQIEDARRAG